MIDNYDEYRDEFGLEAPIPASHGQRTMLPEDANYGPQKGEALPGFTLRSSTGADLDFHEDRGESKAALVFIRSAVW